MRPQHRSEETRACLLEAAAACFARYGYEATGVAEICERAGLSKGAFYHHFPSKQALFLALLDRWLETLDASMAQAQLNAETVPEALEQMAARVQEAVQREGSNLPILLEFWTQAVRDPAVWEEAIAPYRRYRDFLAQMIEKGVVEGSFSPVEPQTAARVAASLLIGVLFQSLLDPEGGQWGEVMQQGIKIMLLGLKKAQP